jgi:hypothetical protein
MEAGDFSISVGNHVACAVIGVLNGEFGLFVQLWTVSFRSLLKNGPKDSAMRYQEVQLPQADDKR